jgi:hypothetical protein
MHLHQLRHHGWLVALAGLTAAVGLVTAAVLGSCVTGAKAVTGSSAGSPPTVFTTPESSPTTRSVDPAAVLAGVQAAAALAEGSIRVVVLDAEGQPLITGPDAGAPTYTASLVKVLVVARLLALDAAGSLALSGEDLDLMQRAIVRSDDAAMSRLWDRFDGAQLMTDMATTVGMTGTTPPAVAGQWGRASTTAADVATMLAALGDVLDDADADTLLGWMRSTSAVAADGFDQWFGLLDRGGGTTAAKQVDVLRRQHPAAALSRRPGRRTRRRPAR